MNDLLMKSLERVNDQRPPVWLMRQAGRYMPRYQALRAKTSLFDMFHHEEIIEQVTMLPIEILDVDAAIVFSDILLPLECLHLHVHFPDIGGPYVSPVVSPQSHPQFYIKTAKETMPFLYRSMARLRKRLHVPLIGFAGAPFTTATYALEEKGTHKDLKNTKNYLASNRAFLHQFLEALTTVIIDHIDQQIQAGAKVIQLFDSWAGMLSHADFLEFSSHYLKKIIDHFKPTTIPFIVFARGSCHYAEDLSNIDLSAISLDSEKSVLEIREKVGKEITLQGNIDPELLLQGKQAFLNPLKKLLEEMNGDPAFIVNLGHGVLPGTKQDDVRLFVDTVKEFAT